jgi:hypothetical protein
MSILAILLLTAAPASAAAMPEPKPSEMSASEIRAQNKLLDRKDPYYIKCVREADTGSLVGRKPVCRTNERWAVLEKGTRAGADQLASDMTTNSHSSGN